jgi:hypothetical protein
MKTFKLLLFFSSVFAISAAFFACDGTTPPDPAATAPGLTFSTPDPAKPLVQADRYELIKFNFTATSNASTKKELSSIKIVKTVKGVTGSVTLIDSSATTWSSKTSKKIEYNYTIPGDATWGSVITITITVEDIAQQKASKAFSFTVTNLSDLNHYDSLTVGAQNNVTIGSYFSTETGSVWLKAMAQSNKTKVDFIYFFSENDANCITAPNGTEVLDITSLVQGWTATEKNNTEFKKVLMSDDTEFDRIRSADSISKKFLGGGTTNVIKSVTAGGGVSTTYIVFKTAHGKYGILKVDEILEDPDQTKSSMIISVKVQK